MEPSCLLKMLPADQMLLAARAATEINPANCPLVQGDSPVIPTPDFLAVLTSKYWKSTGVDLSVGFMESTSLELRNRILSHMNYWGNFANIKFRLSQTAPQVRISFHEDGYWSYLGTDILQINSDEATMNLQGFTNSTPEAEFVRVVRHETGHTCGFPHEHSRRSIIALLDEQKVIAYFRRTQGWSAATVRQQILTPLEERSVFGSEVTDSSSIMCYSFPGSVTKNGQPIPGGSDLTVTDKEFSGKLYPKPAEPPPPPPPGANYDEMRLYRGGAEIGRYRIALFAEERH